MNREILFRGKSLTSGDFVYGDLIQYEPIPCIRCLDYEDNYNEIEVNKETIGQFTGLTDKNGVKIFEGDILKYDNTEGIIFFEDGSFFAKFEYLRSSHLLGELERELEIIGNIHD